MEGVGTSDQAFVVFAHSEYEEGLLLGVPVAANAFKGGGSVMEGVCGDIDVGVLEGYIFTFEKGEWCRAGCHWWLPSRIFAVVDLAYVTVLLIQFVEFISEIISVATTIQSHIIIILSSDGGNERVYRYEFRNYPGSGGAYS